MATSAGAGRARCNRIACTELSVQDRKRAKFISEHTFTPFEAGVAAADLNHDNKVDLVDLSIMLFNWTKPK